MPYEEIENYYNDLAEKTILKSVPNCKPTGFFSQTEPLLYIICRALKPMYVVETGVAAGISSTMILCALEDNNYGELFSIDLPNVKYRMDNGKLHVDITPLNREPGWAIPEVLRTRWHLILGLTSEKLLSLLEQLMEIQLFLHDSEHTYTNMMFEYSSAWKYLAKGGVLLSDDIEKSRAFRDFSSNMKVKPTLFFYWFGGIRKQ
jgi:hypothetical protein